MIAEEARNFPAATADVAGDQIVAAHQRLVAAVESGKEMYTKVRAKGADEVIVEHPYQAIAVGVGVGALLGYRVSKRLAPYVIDRYSFEKSDSCGLERISVSSRFGWTTGLSSGMQEEWLPNLLWSKGWRWTASAWSSCRAGLRNIAIGVASDWPWDCVSVGNGATPAGA